MYQGLAGLMGKKSSRSSDEDVRTQSRFVKTEEKTDKKHTLQGS